MGLRRGLLPMSEPSLQAKKLAEEVNRYAPLDNGGAVVFHQNVFESKFPVKLKN